MSTVFRSEINKISIYDNLYLGVILLIGKRIKDLRKKRKLTQAELSDSINIGQSTLANFENGKRTIPVDIVIQLAQFFNVSTDYLLGLSNSPNMREIIHGEQLSSEEKEIVDVYRNLNADGKRILLGKALDLKLSGVTAAPNKKKDVG